MKEIFEATGWSLGAAAVLWALALLPGAIVVHHALYLYFPRRQQFKMSLLGASNPGVSKRLEELYFGWISIVVRYVLPALKSSSPDCVSGA